eukprot:TRINITY_DN59599_c0_g1_i1.p2 TRINITY_DN59599_c0_g1~~TRINITY_DN59599_c0_g1_i1.p2  ORF type:complete len:133 (+),score=11.60 TRINITY_DN59599_c0_g1_i1:1051-1449(+)
MDGYFLHLILRLLGEGLPKEVRSDDGLRLLAYLDAPRTVSPHFDGAGLGGEPGAPVVLSICAHGRDARRRSWQLFAEGGGHEKAVKGGTRQASAGAYLPIFSSRAWRRGRRPVGHAGNISVAGGSGRDGPIN